MLGIIKTGGKQYIVSPGKTLKVEKLGKNSGEELVFGEVLLVGNEDGTDVAVGKPFVTAAHVSGKVIAQKRSRKIKILKYKPKKRYRKRIGHRQPYSEVEITSVGA